MGTRYGPIEYREKDHYDIDQKLLSVDHCESMSYFGDFNHIWQNKKNFRGCRKCKTLTLTLTPPKKRPICKNGYNSMMSCQFEHDCASG